MEGIATARLLDRSGKPLMVPVTVSERRDEDGFRWIVADASLAPMAMGDYAVEVTLAGAKQVTPFCVVPYRGVRLPPDLRPAIVASRLL